MKTITTVHIAYNVYSGRVELIGATKYDAIQAIRERGLSIDDYNIIETKVYKS